MLSERLIWLTSPEIFVEKLEFLEDNLNVRYGLEGCLEVESVVFSLKYKENQEFTDFIVPKEELKIEKNLVF